MFIPFAAVPLSVSAHFSHHLLLLLHVSYFFSWVREHFHVERCTCTHTHTHFLKKPLLENLLTNVGRKENNLKAQTNSWHSHHKRKHFALAMRKKKKQNEHKTRNVKIRENHLTYKFNFPHGGGIKKRCKIYIWNFSLLLFSGFLLHFFFSLALFTVLLISASVYSFCTLMFIKVYLFDKCKRWLGKRLCFLMNPFCREVTPH